MKNISLTDIYSLNTLINKLFGVWKMCGDFTDNSKEEHRWTIKCSVAWRIDVNSIAVLTMLYVRSLTSILQTVTNWSIIVKHPWCKWRNFYKHIKKARKLLASCWRVDHSILLLQIPSFIHFIPHFSLFRDLLFNLYRGWWKTLPFTFMYSLQ